MPPDDSRVLIVSPLAEVRAAYSEYLRRHGLAVDVAADVIDGFAQAVAAPPAVVVVDDATPGAGEFLSRFRVATRTRETSCLLLASSVPIARDLRHMGAVVLKPAWPDDFYGKVLRLVLDKSDSRNDVRSRSCGWRLILGAGPPGVPHGKTTR